MVRLFFIMLLCTVLKSSNAQNVACSNFYIAMQPMNNGEVGKKKVVVNRETLIYSKCIFINSDNYTIEKFTIGGCNRGSLLFADNDGAILNKGAKSVIGRLKSGDRITIDQVYIKNADGVIFKCQDLTLQITVE